MKAKLLVVDDHPLVRDGLRHALARQPDFALVGEASTGAAGVGKAVELRPDLVVMDLHLPDMSGVEATRQILRALPQARVIVLSADAARPQVNSALEAGACGYVLKQSLADELLQAIHSVLEGRLFLSPAVSADLLEDYRRTLAGESRLPGASVTARERLLLVLIAEGKRNKEIADQLKLSVNSVETYRARLMKKLGCSRTMELVRYAIREGIVRP